MESVVVVLLFCFFFQAEDGIRDLTVTGVQTCALPIFRAECTARETWHTPAGRPPRQSRASPEAGGPNRAEAAAPRRRAGPAAAGAPAPGRGGGSRSLRDGQSAARPAPPPATDSARREHGRRPFQ